MKSDIFGTTDRNDLVGLNSANANSRRYSNNRLCKPRDSMSSVISYEGNGNVRVREASGQHKISHVNSTL